MTIEERIEEWLRIAEDCVNNGTLTNWDSSFLVAIIDQLERGRPLSQNQEEQLHRIRGSQV